MWRILTRGGGPRDHSDPAGLWWYAVAAGLLAATLLETGDHAEAEAVAQRGLALGDTAMAGGRLRCLAAVAALGDGEATAEATRLLDEVECQPGHAWVTGADVYLLLDRPDILAPAIARSWPSLRPLVAGRFADE